jgi:hypothetical protein
MGVYIYIVEHGPRFVAYFFEFRYDKVNVVGNTGNFRVVTSKE